MDMWTTLGAPTGIKGIRKRKLRPLSDDRQLHRHPIGPISRRYASSSVRDSRDATQQTTTMSRKRPEPPRKRRSKLEVLPTEILHRIFCEASCPAFSLASLPLTRVFNSKHLQLDYVRGCTDLSIVFTMRFFTKSFLHFYEERHGALDATGCVIPGRLSAHPWPMDNLDLIKMLAQRGATLRRDLNAHRENLVQAIAHYRGLDLLSALNNVSDFEAHSAAVWKAIRAARSAEESLTLCRVLVEDCKADISDSNVWRAALARKDGGFVQFLLEHGTPPVEVLGELGDRQQI